MYKSMRNVCPSKREYLLMFETAQTAPEILHYKRLKWSVLGVGQK